jgi:hypothetical protein
LHQSFNSFKASKVRAGVAGVSDRAIAKTGSGRSVSWTAVQTASFNVRRMRIQDAWRLHAPR